MKPNQEPVMIDIPTTYQHDPIGFIDHFVTLNEKGRPWSLTPHQHRILSLAFQWQSPTRYRQSGSGSRRAVLQSNPSPDATLGFRLLLWSEPKKSGKTFLAALLGLWWAFTHANTEIIVAANDLEQAQSRVFRTVLKLIEHNQALGPSCSCLSSSITLSNGTTITAISSDYKGAAGGRHSLVIYDELWAYMTEGACRLFEELTPIPTENDSWVLVVTYAGWTGESVLLESLYQRGLSGERLDPELEIFKADDLVMFWSHTPRQPWQTPNYYAQQRRLLRPGTYARLHENRWVSAESTFLHADLFDPCVNSARSPLLPTKTVSLWVGVDVGIKHDSSAVVAIYRDGNRLVLACHRLWYPSKDHPLNIEESVEAYLYELRQHFSLRKILCDPYQLHRSITTLKAQGLPIEEFPQSVPNCTRMGQTLFDLFNGRNLILYPAPELRQQALNTTALEHARGWKLSKEKTSKKIDAIVALAMACVAAVEDGQDGQWDVWGGGPAILLDSDDPIEVARKLRRMERKMASMISQDGWWTPESESSLWTDPHHNPWEEEMEEARDDEA